MTAFLPVFKRDEVVAWALVDVDDLAIVQGFRWKLNNYGYATRSTAGRPWEQESELAMHRSIMRVGYLDPQVVHHVNERKLDNRRSNLQLLANASEHGRTWHSYWTPEWLRKAA